MKNKKSLLFRALFILLIFSVAVLILNSAPQISQEKTSQNQKLKPTPKNIKESTAFYVYIFWMWVVIFILIYVLILKIKEADRIHKMGFEKNKKES